MFDVKGASIWSFFFCEGTRRKDKKGRRREKVCLSLVFQNDFKNTNNEQRTPTTEQQNFFLDVEFAPKKPSNFLRRRRRTHTDFENAASGDAGEAAALEPRREHVDVGIACSRPKDDDSFPQTSL